MSQVVVQTKNFLLAPLAALFLAYPTLKTVAQTHFPVQGRHFYLSPLAVQKVTTPLNDSPNLLTLEFDNMRKNFFLK